MSDETIEQATLFDLPEPTLRRAKATHPTDSPKIPLSASPIQPKSKPKPYVLRHKTYSEYLKVFCGDSALALYWFNKQYLKS